jgi:hypothetical protein
LEVGVGDVMRFVAGIPGEMLRPGPERVRPDNTEGVTVVFEWYYNGVSMVSEWSYFVVSEQMERGRSEWGLEGETGLL